MTRTRLDGKVVFVTGAGAGIGLDAAQRLHARGARVVIVDIDKAAAEAQAARLEERALGLGGDVTDRGQLDVAVAQAIAMFGRIDVVIANAGIAPPVESVRTGSEAAFDRVLDVNLHGVVNTIRATLPVLIDAGGYLLVISSLYAVVNGALSASPEGSSRRICLPPTPVTISLRRCAPTLVNVSTRPFRSDTSSENRFQPPGGESRGTSAAASCRGGLDAHFHRDVRTEDWVVPALASSAESSAFVERNRSHPRVAPQKASPALLDMVDDGLENRRAYALTPPVLGRSHPPKPPRLPSRDGPRSLLASN
jgi:NAD(P)-dependent dehydrogenase (short-subunit alcohol dehydrogenase family)